MSSRLHMQRSGLAAPFDVRIYLTCVVTDLAASLGECAGALLALVHKPAEFKGLCSALLSDADCMDDCSRYAALRQVEACYKKLPAYGAASADARKTRAVEKFHASERSCARANRRIKFYAAHPDRMSRVIRSVFSQAQYELALLLGPVSWVEDEIHSGCGFGPGLAYGFQHDERHLLRKIAGDQTVTPECKPLAIAVLQSHFPHWVEELKNWNVHTVPGNRITTVSKTAEIDRTIGIEPSLNVFLQKGVDNYLKRRLTHLGLRLTSQDYSIDCIKQYGTDVSTIDLSSASDSVSIELVRWLLPRDWFELLDVLRSKSFTVDGGVSWTRYEKFSSMGNATTFPLESMIFMSIARACCLQCGFSKESIKDMVRVYGDDIIVPWEAAGLCLEALRFIGFKHNVDKTFVFGPFRETCGVDLLHGVDVRPVYLREIPTKPWTVASIFNRMLVNRFGFVFESTLCYLYSLVANPLTGPAWLGQTAIEARDFGNWYAGKCSEGDAYFFAPYPHHKPVLTYHLDQPTWYVVRQRWGVLRRRSIPGSYSENARYLAFLLGLEGGEPAGQPIIGVMEDVVPTASYPDLRWWPGCYAGDRPASDRVLRLIQDELLGQFL